MKNFAPLFFFLICVTHQSQAQIDTTGLTHFLHQRKAEVGLPGMYVSVIHNGNTVYSKPFGDFSSDSSYAYIGSMTKSFTALLTLKLVQDSLLTLHDSITTFLPNYSFTYNDTLVYVSVKDLLNQTSGFSRIQGFIQLEKSEKQTFELDEEPGKVFQYSNINYTLLGKICEQVSGKSLEELYSEHIFEPAHFGTTFTNRSAPSLSNMAQGHQLMFGWNWERNERVNHNDMLASGGIILNAKQMETYLGIMVDSTALEQTLGLSKLSKATLFKPYLDKEFGYAMGWVKREYKKSSIWTHSGLTGSFSSSMLIHPDSSLAISILATNNSFTASNYMLYGTLNYVYKQPIPDVSQTEKYIRWGILALFLLNSYQLGDQVVKWNNRGNPTRFSNKTSDLLRLGADIALPVAILFGVEWYSQMPIGNMVRFQPDLGLALTIGTGFSITTGFLKALK